MPDLSLMILLWQQRAEDALRRANEQGRTTFEGKAATAEANAIIQCLDELRRALGR